MRKNLKYYTICNPTDQNKTTGNFCVNLNDVLKFDKDFLYKTEDSSYLVPKEIVKDNMKMTYCTKYDDYGKKKCFPFVLIPFEIIKDYEQNS